MISLPLLVLLFFVSGAASLVFQVAAMKLYSLHLGTSVLASTLVVVAYMLGLALGARLLGARADGWERPLRGYGLLELGVALTGLAVPASGAWMAGDGLLVLVEGWLPVRESGAAYVAVKGVVALLALLLPTTLMGGTLPVLVKELTRRERSVDRTVPLLYAVNALGAAAGALAAGFLLLPNSGIGATLRTALLLYALVGGVALLLDRRAREEVEEEGEGAAGARDREPPAAPRAQEALSLRAAMALLGGTGALLMALEHAWFRYFVLVLDSSTYSFSVVLGAVILGIGLGSTAAELRTRTRPASMREVFGALALAALVATASVPLLDDLPYVFLRLRVGLDLGWGATTLVKLLLALAVVLVPAGCSGFVYPLVTALAARHPGEEGRRVGAVAAANTAGTVVGMLGATFLAVPLWGLERTFWLCAAGLSLAALASWAALPRTPARPRAPTLAVCALLGAAVATPSTWVWVRIGSASYRELRPGADVDAYWESLEARPVEEVFREHGDLAVVSVERWDHGVLSLRINGKVDASTGTDMPTQRYVAHLPLLLHPDPGRVLVIGMGSGVSAGAALLHPVERVDVCELEPAVVAAARHFSEANRDALDSPRTRVLVEDARTLVARSTEAYDVIVSQPTNPWIAGVASLFTVEYFQRLRERLAPGGIHLQWIQLYENDLPTLSIVLKSFREVFPGASVWLMGHRDVALVARRDGAVVPDLDRLTERLEALGAVRADVAALGLTSPLAVLGSNVLSPAGLGAWILPEAHRNTDDSLALEFEAPFAQHARRVVDLPFMDAAAPYARLPQEALPVEVRREVGLYYAVRTGGGATLRELAAVAQARPEDHRARYWLGVELAGMGQALPALQQLLPAAPSEPRALGLIAEILEEAEDAALGPHRVPLTRTLLRLAEPGLAAGSVDPGLRARLARVAARAGLADAAVRLGGGS